MSISVEDWFQNRHILITGATGFMGKVLVEKLLRSCPNIAGIYILIRSKRGKDSHQRLEEFTNSPVFDVIRNNYDSESLYNKLHCLPGDILQPNLNLSLENLTEIKNNVSVVFHMAANVRFDQPLKSALLMNTGGTLNMLELATEFKKLISFVHVSTSYCHCDETELEERPYAAPHSPRKLLDMVTWMDEPLINHLTPSLLKDAPNTYAYTKCLTEQLVAEYKNVIPVSIARPSIVTASWKEPFAGWVENLNGPTGLLVGAGKGVIRSMHCQADYVADLMPVDVSINNIILVAWERGANQLENNDVLVVNVCTKEDNPITWGNSLETGKKHFYQNPFTICLWYPNGSIKSNYYIHMLSVFLFHIIPAYFIDFLMVLFRQKPFLVQTQKRIQNGLEVLQYYTTRKWIFHNDKIKKIHAKLNVKEKESFFIDIVGLNWDQYILNYILGARKYCVHEEPHSIPKARKILQRLYYLDCAKNVLFISLFIWFFWHYAQTVLNSVGHLVEDTVGTMRIKN